MPFKKSSLNKKKRKKKNDFLQQSISLDWFEFFPKGSTLARQDEAVNISSDSGLFLQTGALCSANISPLNFSRPKQGRVQRGKTLLQESL